MSVVVFVFTIETSKILCILERYIT